MTRVGVQVWVQVRNTYIENPTGNKYPSTLLQNKYNRWQFQMFEEVVRPNFTYTIIAKRDSPCKIPFEVRGGRQINPNIAFPLHRVCPKIQPQLSHLAIYSGRHFKPSRLRSRYTPAFP